MRQPKCLGAGRLHALDKKREFFLAGTLGLLFLVRICAGSPPVLDDHTCHGEDDDAAEQQPHRPPDLNAKTQTSINLTDGKLKINSPLSEYLRRVIKSERILPRDLVLRDLLFEERSKDIEDLPLGETIDSNAHHDG